MAKKGFVFTKEHRKKISKAHKGMKKPWVKPPKDRSKALQNLKRGDRHWAWKGGVTPKSVKDRNSGEYKLWRKSVFERDDYTCQKCGKRGVYLHAHHIKPFALNEDLRFEI